MYSPHALKKLCDKRRTATSYIPPHSFLLLEPDPMVPGRFPKTQLTRTRRMNKPHPLQQDSVEPLQSWAGCKRPGRILRCPEEQAGGCLKVGG